MTDDFNNGGGSGRARTVGQPVNQYPSPFFDVARTYLPQTIKATFDWCAFYYATSSLVGCVVDKLASYAITDLVYESGDAADTYKDLFEGSLNLRTFLVEFNLDRLVFGNAFASVIFPFIKYLKCPSCKTEIEAGKADYKFRAGSFQLTCASCKETGTAKAIDKTVPAPGQIKLHRWNPKTITIRRNDATNELRYFYEMPKYLRNELMAGKRYTIEHTPQAYIEALHSNKIIELDPNSVFHSRRPGPSRDPADNGWGPPLILRVLKDVFLLQVLKKAQETVMYEYILPFRSLYPEIRADGNNVYGSINLKQWQRMVQTQVEQWKKDPAHIAVMPVPIGQQVMGGNGKQLLLHQEQRAYSDLIIAGLGVPTGFVYGESLFSGASVNMRAMENEFIANRQDMQHLIDFFVKRIGRGLQLGDAICRFKPFKMADDMARAGLEMQMVGGSMLSKRTFVQSRDFDYELEVKQIDKEMAETATRNRTASEAATVTQALAMRTQSEAQMAMQQAQAAGMPGQEQEQAQDPSQQGQAPEAPQAPSAPQGPSGPAGPEQIQQQAALVAQQMAHLDEVGRYRQLAQMKQQDPDLYQAVNQLLQNRGSTGNQSQQLPEQRPSRAGPGKAMI